MDASKMPGALRALGLPVTEDTKQQMAVLARALKVYIEREAEYGETWKQFDVADAAHHVTHKAARMRAVVGAPRLSGEVEEIVHAAAVDSALDAINYSAFYIRHEEGNK